MELYESHTPYEWAMQVAMAIVEPFGEDRADERAAWNTIVSKAMEAGTIDDPYKTLTTYATGETDDLDQLEVNPQALAKLRSNHER